MSISGFRLWRDFHSEILFSISLFILLEVNARHCSTFLQSFQQSLCTFLQNINVSHAHFCKTEPQNDTFFIFQILPNPQLVRNLARWRIATDTIPFGILRDDEHRAGAALGRAPAEARRGQGRLRLVLRSRRNAGGKAPANFTATTPKPVAAEHGQGSARAPSAVVLYLSQKTPNDRQTIRSAGRSPHLTAFYRTRIIAPVRLTA